MTKYLQQLKIYLLIFLANSPIVSSASNASLDNPLNFGENSENGVADLLLAIVDIFQIIAVPIIVFFIIYGGFLYVTARGNPEAIQKASKALVYAIIGGVIVAGAEAISLIIDDTAKSFKPD